jgi:DNA helicase II / ATP-dependent DNA helicase PcrA
MDNYSKYYDELNAEQKACVDTTEGPLLVLAGPGTGKTQLLSVRAGSIIRKGAVSPENVLILTYTNSAAKAMKERLGRIIGMNGYDVWAGTFHSFANSLIQESADAANYVGDRIQMDDVERASALEYVFDNADGIEEIRPFRAPYTYLKEAAQKISELKKDGITPQVLEAYLGEKKGGYEYLEEKHVKRLEAFSRVYKMYEELKEGRNPKIFDGRGRYDFDDMILYASAAIKNEPDLKSECRRQYRYIMVDEFQDTNFAQLELLFELLDCQRPNVACVGDDDQSIYRFQGANIANFRLLSQRFPDTKTIKLSDNYRSSAELIVVSSRVIDTIPLDERMAAKDLVSKVGSRTREITYREFTTETEELLFIVDKIRKIKDEIEKDSDLSDEERRYPFNNIAILVRKRESILRVIDALLRAGIPYATDGKEDISSEPRVRQLEDVLELAHAQPSSAEARDIALYKVLASDYFEIPQSDILRFISYVNDLKKRSARPITMLEKFLEHSSRKKPSVKLENPGKFETAGRVIKDLLDGTVTKSAHSLLMDYIKEAGLFKYILRRWAKEGILRIRELRALGSFVNMVKAADMAKPAIRLDDFMRDMKTRKDHDIAIRGELVTLSQPGVRVYTAHGSKGLEFHSVIIPFCLQGVNWPVRRISEKIILPSDLFRTREIIKDRQALKALSLQDETRLFYVAMTRAKSNLVFTATASEDNVGSFFLERAGIPKDESAGVNEEALIGKSLEVTSLEDPFIGTEAVLADMIANLTLNPTRLNAYITCRRRFLYNDVLKLPGHKKKSLIFGNCVHKALEETYKAFKNTGAFPGFSFFERAFSKELVFQGVDKQMARELVKQCKTIKGWFDANAKSSVMPIGLERSLVITVGDNIIFTGKYDKVEWEDEAKRLVRIVDYKTGKPDDHLIDIDKNKDLAGGDCDGYLRQLVCYKLLFEKDEKESRGRSVSHGVLAFIEPVTRNLRAQGYKKGDYATKTIEISDEMVAEIEGVIRRAWSDIKKLRFEKLPRRNDRICSNCDFDTICWK